MKKPSQPPCPALTKSGNGSAVYKVGELFSGPGGMALGFAKARLNGHKMHHVWACDNHKDSCITLQNNLPDIERVDCKDVAKVDWKKLSPIDGLLFGFPCNDFSVIGEKNGISGQYGGLYRWGVKALRFFKPAFFVAENVGGLAVSDKRSAFRIILQELEESGYDIQSSLYNFEQYGVPQSRRRIIIAGFRKDLGVQFEHPEAKKGEPMTCRQALEEPPIDEDAANHERTMQSDIVVKRLQCIKPGENVFTASLPPSLRLNLKSGATISQIYKRLDPDKPAYTVTGSGGGGTHIYHWEEPRALTNRERARLQTFPDDFVFFGGKESVRRQIGMAVPPKAAEIIARSILQHLAARGVSPC